MAEDKIKETPPAPQVPAKAKTLEYVGPKPAPLMGNFPGDGYNTYHADELNEEQRAFVLATVPDAATWWK